MAKNVTTLFVGGGTSGRFGACFLQALGGHPIIFEKHSLGGECHRCRCAFENFIFDQSSMAAMLKLYSGKSWYPKFDLSNISMARATETYRRVGAPSFEEIMEFQTTKQLNVEVIWGDAKILNPKTIAIDGQKHEGDALVIATGSRPTIPNLPGVELKGVMTYLDHATMTTDTKQMVVIGGGRIGVGKAAMFAPFGTKVTILEKYTILPEWDEDVRTFIKQHLSRLGVTLIEGADVKEFKGGSNVEAVVADIGGGRKEFPCDSVMFAVGLTPNSEIAKPLGVKIGKRNEIVVDSRFRTSVPNVYAVGDVVGPPYDMAVARKSGMIAAKNIMGADTEMDYSYIPEHVYLSPLEACFVGLTEAEARKKYKHIVKIQLPVGPKVELEPEQFKAGYPGSALPVEGRMHTINQLYYGRQMQGMLKALIDADSRRYVGFHHVGYGAKVAFQYLSYLLKVGWTVDQMADLNEIFLNAEHFIQLSRLIAGYPELVNLA